MPSAPPPEAAARAEPAPAAPPAKASEPAPRRTVEREAPPQESPLTPPAIRSIPEPEPPPPAPPPPPRVAAPAPQRPAPSVAALPQAAPPAAPSAAAAAGAPLVDIAFGDGSAALTEGERERIRQAASQHAGAVFRVVGHAPPPRSSDALSHLVSFNMALDRANAVASALSEAGVPSAQIRVEAAPSATDAGAAAQRASVFVEQ
jgi:outer membrane protein OmpA-like peptidoglycan-associated protein